MRNAVHLREVRCDGSGHDGCQANCLIYWKADWLRAVSGTEDSQSSVAVTDVPPLITAASRGVVDRDGVATYRCQATELPHAAPEPLPVRRVGQFADDVRTGNWSAWSAIKIFSVAVYNFTQAQLARRLPASMKRLAGHQWGAISGVPGPTPTGRTDLQVGEMVRVRSRDEIQQTLDEKQLNRGLGFDAEMARFCGVSARVAGQIDHIIDERTGRMLTMKQPCIRLEGIYCEGALNNGCPRSLPPYWREIWLERVDQPANS
jgi:hypothetical protein